MSNPSIVDSHVHLWDPALFDYDWLAGSDLNCRHAVEDLNAVAGPLAEIVVVQADCAPQQGLAEVAWITEQAERAPVIAGIVAFAPVELGRAVLPMLTQLTESPLVVGVRRLLQDEPANFMLQDSFLTGLTEVGEAGLTFDICVRDTQLRNVVEMVTRSPGVQFVLDHLGKPQIGADDETWRADLVRLARLPNVVCKLSGLSTEFADGPFAGPRVLPYLRHALDVLGPNRCLFGSDWPVLTESITYRRWLDAVIDALDHLGSEARRQVLGDNARRVYQLVDPRVPLHEDAP